MNAAKRKWQGLMQTLCVPHEKADKAWATLSRLYGERGRHHHNMRHISSFVHALTRFGGQHLEMPVWFAVFYHDAIYDPRLHSNEARSADLSWQEMMELGFSTHWCGHTDELIRATQKHEPLTKGPLVESSKLFMDCDLLILGSAPAAYDRYARAIRLEYSHVPEAEFRSKRAELLETFCKRERIYLTPAVHQLYEAAARANLAREILSLRAAA